MSLCMDVLIMDYWNLTFYWMYLLSSPGASVCRVQWRLKYSLSNYWVSSKGYWVSDSWLYWRSLHFTCTAHRLAFYMCSLFYDTDGSNLYLQHGGIPPYTHFFLLSCFFFLSRYTRKELYISKSCSVSSMQLEIYTAILLRQKYNGHGRLYKDLCSICSSYVCFVFCHGLYAFYSVSSLRKGSCINLLCHLEIIGASKGLIKETESIHGTF